MDIIIPVIIMILIFITCSICGYCCKRNKQGIVYGVANPTTVTTQPYPNIPPHSQVNATTTGFVTTAPYPTNAPYHHTAPYPPISGAPPGFHPMPMPVTGGFNGNTPYPPMPMPGTGAFTAPVPPYPPQTSAAHQLPPSYAEAVTQPPTNEVYAKQAPYNPNFN